MFGENGYYYDCKPGDFEQPPNNNRWFTEIMIGIVMIAFILYALLFMK